MSQRLARARAQPPTRASAGRLAAESAPPDGQQITQAIRLARAPGSGAAPRLDRR
jgi:hypothetical protein